MTIMLLILLCLINFGATKVIYDRLFARYEHDPAPYPDEIGEMVAKRERVFFPSGENTLCGFLYTSADPKDTLVVLAGGYHTCSDDYLRQIRDLLGYGWSVFAFDSTGCGESEGRSAVGFSQQLLDLNAALDHLETHNRFGYRQVALLGHSRGGYAVCCALRYHSAISAVVSVGGINSPMEGVIGAARRYVGRLAYLNYLPLWLYQSALFGGNLVRLKAHEVLRQTATPVLIVQGENDRIAPVDRVSIYSHKDRYRNDNVRHLLRCAPNTSGHVDVFCGVMEAINSFLEQTQR